MVDSDSEVRSGAQVSVRVRWETLGGTVKSKKFTDWMEAESFGAKLEANPSIQWVDYEGE